MAKDPTKAKRFKTTLANLLSAPPKPHSEMKLGKAKVKQGQNSGKQVSKQAKK
jgi:hypothetical protein